MTSNDIRQNNIRAVYKYFTLLELRLIAEWSELSAPDCVHWLPYAHDPLPQRLVGKTEITSFYSSMLGSYQDLHFTNIAVRPMHNVQEVFCTWHPRGKLLNGSDYSNMNAGIFEFDEYSTITHLTEFFDPFGSTEIASTWDADHK